MILLGMTGPIGHGKTTLANALAEIVPKTVRFESSLVIAEVANAWQATLKEPIDPYDINALNNWLRSLPAILLEKLDVHCTFEQLELDQQNVDRHPIEFQKLILHVENLRRNFTLAHQDITPQNKENYRPLLQWLGGYLVARVDPGIWYTELVRRVKIEEQKGTELCLVGGLRFPTDAAILREAGAIIVKVYRPGHLQNDMLDPTERERDNIQADTTIMSNGSVDHVNRFAMQFLDDLHNNKLQKLYQTGRA